MAISAKGIVRKLRAGYSAKVSREAEAAKPEIRGIPTAVPVAWPYPFPVQPYAPAPGAAPVKEKAAEGVEITTKFRPGRKMVSTEERETLSGIDIAYPLIPRVPQKGEAVYAYARIKWDPQKLQLVYSLTEPAIGPDEKAAIDNVKRELEERLDINLAKLGTVKAKEALRREAQRSMDILGLKLSPEQKSAVIYYIERDTVGFGVIDALMADPNIEDISCDGVGIPIFVYHRDPRIASVKTNTVFESTDELNSFAVKLAQKCNKTISIAEPLLDGTLPDGSRIQATLGTDIARKGSNFTIRKFTEKPLTPTHMMSYKTLDSTQLAYLWLAVEGGQSILVSGGTATGKTSLLNALSLFIRPTLKVVSIEDTAELRLYHPHWIPHVARTPLAVKGRFGEVTLFDLLRSSLRQRPDYIIVGEVRGEEAFVLFQQMATGHPSLATIHAASIPQLVDRLIAPPINLPPSLLENIDIIIFLTLSRLKERYVRRTDSIHEVTGLEADRPVTNRVFEWKPIEDSYEIVGKSFVLRKIAHKSGVTEDSIKEELVRRKMILEWMLEREMFDYREVTSLIQAYYTNPEKVLETIGI